MDIQYSLEVSKILDKHLPSDGVGTERESLRMAIHKDITSLLNKVIIYDDDNDNLSDITIKYNKFWKQLNKDKNEQDD